MRHPFAVVSLRSEEKGHTLLELLVAMSLFSVISFLFLSTYLDMDRQVAQLESVNRLASTGEAAVNVIKDELLQAKEIFSRNERGIGYLSFVDFCEHAPMAGSQLPLIRPLGSISPSDLAFDAADVGNMVFFVKTMAPVWLHLPTTDTWRIVNVYKFACYYLAMDFSPQAVGLPETPGRLDLMWWESNRYAEHRELNELLSGLGEEDVVAVITQLAAVQIERTWDNDAAVETGFYDISLLEPPYLFAVPVVEVEQYDCRSLLSQLHGMDPGTGSSVAYNGLATEMASDKVPRFADAEGNFPGGFEVVAAGVQASRRVYLRLVTAVWYGQTDTILARESTALVSPGIR